MILFCWVQEKELRKMLWESPADSRYCQNCLRAQAWSLCVPPVTAPSRAASEATRSATSWYCWVAVLPENAGKAKRGKFGGGFVWVCHWISLNLARGHLQSCLVFLQITVNILWFLLQGNMSLFPYNLNSCCDLDWVCVAQEDFSEICLACQRWAVGHQQGTDAFLDPSSKLVNPWHDNGQNVLQEVVRGAEWQIFGDLKLPQVSLVWASAKAKGARIRLVNMHRGAKCNEIHVYSLLCNLQEVQHQDQVVNATLVDLDLPAFFASCCSSCSQLRKWWFLGTTRERWPRWPIDVSNSFTVEDLWLTRSLTCYVQAINLFLGWETWRWRKSKNPP